MRPIAAAPAGSINQFSEGGSVSPTGTIGRAPVKKNPHHHLVKDREVSSSASSIWSSEEEHRKLHMRQNHSHASSAGGPIALFSNQQVKELIQD